MACSAWKNEGSVGFDSAVNVHRNIANLSSAAIPPSPFMKSSSCLAAALACLAAGALAQTPAGPASPHRGIYLYQGADRDKPLGDGAQKERHVLCYSRGGPEGSRSKGPTCSGLRRWPRRWAKRRASPISAGSPR